MAYSVRVEAYHGPATTPVLRLEPRWWNKDQLMSDSRFASVEETQGYTDYVATLTVAEFAELHERYKPEVLNRGLWDRPNTRGESLMFDGLIAALSGSQLVRIVVTVFEWESGY